MDDLISRSALLKSFDVAWMIEYDETGCGVRRKAIPVKTIEDAPAIEAEPVRRGWWKRYIEDWRHQIDYHECSVCGFKYGGLGVEFFHYCPNCGTPMDRKEANAPAKEPNKVCPINNAPCNECVPGAHCAKMDGGAAHD